MLPQTSVCVVKPSTGYPAITQPTQTTVSMVSEIFSLFAFFCCDVHSVSTHLLTNSTSLYRNLTVPVVWYHISCSRVSDLCLLCSWLSYLIYSMWRHHNYCLSRAAVSTYSFCLTLKSTYVLMSCAFCRRNLPYRLSDFHNLMYVLHCIFLD